MSDMKNFAITGVAGFVAPRHLRAIRDTGNRVVAATDPHDSVGVIDSYFPDAAFFTEFERFDRHLELLRRKSPEERIHWLTVCSPNHLHDAHVRLALRTEADAICEKPLVLNPWNLDALADIEREYGRSVYTVLQLRVHPALIELKKSIDAAAPETRHDVRLTYVTGRGTWYRYSWKGDVARSGGVATNIGIHFFDLLMWLFGRAEANEVHHSSETRSAGFLHLERADVTWFLSIDPSDLPFEPEPGQARTHRSVTVDGEQVEFSGGFTDLHTLVYRETLAGRGFGLEDARASIDLVHGIRHTPPRPPSGPHHPFLDELGIR